MVPALRASARREDAAEGPAPLAHTILTPEGGRTATDVEGRATVARIQRRKYVGDCDAPTKKTDSVLALGVGARYNVVDANSRST